MCCQLQLIPSCFLTTHMNATLSNAYDHNVHTRNASPISSGPFYFPSGNLRNTSISLSSGAASKPAAVSNGGRSGAAGWLRVGTKCLVRSKLRAIASDDAASMALSSAGRSSFSSSRMCSASVSQSESIAGMKVGSAGPMDWNSYSFSFTWKEK
ncbi:hypothetical protein VTI28DRAFT_4149 [Corynascus sepedonium]